MINYNFEWDPQKAKFNYDKHGIGFEEAATVFQSPHTISVYDDEHSENEERWITIGISNTGRLIVVCHTFLNYDNDNVSIRIFSSRKATKLETNQYRD
ncbi:MAG: BrnT family toxin [Desulfobacteraceae bacterium]|nr:BrnT family toxin [Desulfobacteraceae bacterium]